MRIMQDKKNLISALVIIGIVIAGFAAVYFLGRNIPAGPGPESGATSTSAEPTPVGGSDSLGAAVSIGTDNPDVTIEPLPAANKLETDDFTLTLPAGWNRTSPVLGAVAMALKTDEHLGDAAEKIHFQSYIAVSYDTLDGKGLSEYVTTVKNALRQVSANITFGDEADTTVGGRPAHTMEASFNQAGVDFKVLMSMVTGEGEDVWTVSCNTTRDAWDGYKNLFSDTARTFVLNK